MEQKFGKNSILGRAKRPSRADIEALREFCEREGKEVTYRKGDQLEREGDPALTTIEAMVPTRIIRVSGEQLVKRFSQDKKSMDLRCLIAEHLLS